MFPCSSSSCSFDSVVRTHDKKRIHVKEVVLAV